MQNYPPNAMTIKSWAEADRPREKMLLNGKHNLTDAELIAIIIGSGNKELTAVGLAQQILQAHTNDLNNLGKASIADLMKFKGIGEAKAISIVATMELGRRRQMTAIKERPQINGSRSAYNIIAPVLMDLPHEEFWIILMNRANKVLKKERVSVGGTSVTVVDAKILFRKAIEGHATSLILCHNHPSGQLRPSQADLNLTQSLKAAGKTLDINIMDHLIIADGGYYSFADEGVM